MGGLLAARVLADFYDTVTVVERDELPFDPAQRRGVPQGTGGRGGQPGWRAQQPQKHGTAEKRPANLPGEDKGKGESDEA